MQAGYYAANPLEALVALTARVAMLERALASLRGGAGAQMENIAADTPLAALPDADSIPALYLVEEESRDIYRLVCRVVERQPRLYLQRVGRSRPTADVE